MNRPGTEEYADAVAQGIKAAAELGHLIGLIRRAWDADEPDQVHDRVGRARGTIQAVIMRLERADRRLVEMREAILNGEPVE